MTFLVALALTMQETPPDVQGEEIVVTAKRQTCQAYLRGEAMSDRKLSEYAKNWKAGTPVRVRAPRQSDIFCRAQIAFKLGRRGVKLIEFVDSAAP